MALDFTPFFPIYHTMKEANTYAMDPTNEYLYENCHGPWGKTHGSPITPTLRHINFQHGFMMPRLSSHLIFLPWYIGEQFIYHRCLLINLIHECERTLLGGPIVGTYNLINTFGYWNQSSLVLYCYQSKKVA